MDGGRDEGQHSPKCPDLRDQTGPAKNWHLLAGSSRERCCPALPRPDVCLTLCVCVCVRVCTLCMSSSRWGQALAGDSSALPPLGATPRLLLMVGHHHEVSRVTRRLWGLPSFALTVAGASGHSANAGLAAEKATGGTLGFSNAPGQKPLRLTLPVQARVFPSTGIIMTTAAQQPTFSASEAPTHSSPKHCDVRATMSLLE